MSYVKLGNTVHFSITTHSPSGGFAKNADEMPRFWVYEENVDTPLISNSGLTLRTGRVGVYKGEFAASGTLGFEAQKWYEVLVSGQVESINGQLIAHRFYVENHNFDGLAATSGIVRQNLDKTGYVLDPSQSGQFVYYADIRFQKDGFNNRDEYTCQYYRNDHPVPSSAITLPIIQVYNTTTGAALISSGNMDFVNIHVGTVKYFDGSNLTAEGENYIIKCTQTLDGVPRVWQKVLGRDST